jgi:hypothetical protein
LIQDEFTNNLWIHFLSGKSKLSETVINFLKLFQKEYAVKDKKIRLENSGENKAFQDEADKDNELNLTFDTLHTTTQWQNRKKICHLMG